MHANHFCFLAIMKFMAGSVRPVQFLNRSAYLRNPRQVFC
jgi:hypothetical protein